MRSWWWLAPEGWEEDVVRHTPWRWCAVQRRRVLHQLNLSPLPRRLCGCALKCLWGCRGGVLGWGGQSKAVACPLPNKLTMLIRDLGGLGFCYPVTVVSPCSPVPSEIWEHTYRLPMSPSSYRARPHSVQPCLLDCLSTPILLEPQLEFFYSLAQHFLSSIDLSGWEYFVKATSKLLEMA